MKAMFYIFYFILIVMGLFSLGYYCLLLPYVDVSFSKFWLISAVLCGFVFFMLRFIQKNQWNLPIVIRYIILCIIVISLGLFIWVEGRILLQSRDKTYETTEYVVVLGARVRGTVPSLALYQRLEIAEEFLKTNPDAIGILSGGQGEGEDITEAEAMKRYLIEQGIEEDRLIIEEASKNTYENITFSLALIEQKSLENTKISIVTSDFHIYRARQLALEEGAIYVQGLGAPVHPRLKINFYVREFFAVINEVLRGNMTL